MLQFPLEFEKCGDLSTTYQEAQLRDLKPKELQLFDNFMHFASNLQLRKLSIRVDIGVAYLDAGVDLCMLRNLLKHFAGKQIGSLDGTCTTIFFSRHPRRYGPDSYSAWPVEAWNLRSSLPVLRDEIVEHMAANGFTSGHSDHVRRLMESWANAEWSA